MSLHEAFLTEIADNPLDDTPRLVYADWLEENGTAPEQARARFIRLQCRRARLPHGAGEAEHLRQAEQDLLRDHWDAWIKPLRELVGADASRRGEIWLLRPFQPAALEHFARGFVSTLHLTTRHFLNQAAEVYRRLPLNSLQLWEAEPHAQRLAGCPHLAHLTDLAFMDPYQEPLTAAGMRALAGSTHMCRLRSLSLPRNYLGDDGAAALAGAAWLEGLRSLVLDDNGLSSRGVASLAESPRVANLQRLALNDNDLTDQAVESLAGSHHLIRLRNLQLTGNPRLRRAREILLASPNLRQLTHVELDELHP